MCEAPNPELAPWQERSGQMYLSDHELLTELRELTRGTPKDLAESRRRENVIRLQCRYLLKGGFVQQVAHDTFQLSGQGLEYLDDSNPYPSADGFLEIDSLLDLPEWRFTDLSAVDPTIMKKLNDEDFFQDPENDYRWVNENPELTRRRIWNVKGWQLNRLMREFPRIEPLPQQCAHWMRAIVGLHFFPDANHRTGMATLYGLLNANGLAPPNEEWPGEEIDRAVVQSKLIRGLHVTPTFDTLWLRDELFVHWHRYFRGLLCGGKSPTSNEPPTDYLREVLEYAREIRTGL